MIFYMHEQHIVHVPDYCTKYEQSQWIFLREIITNAQNLWKICHNYSNLAQGQILFYMYQQPMVHEHVSNRNIIHPAIIEECARTDWLMDRICFYIPYYWRARNSKLGDMDVLGGHEAIDMIDMNITLLWNLYCTSL